MVYDANICTEKEGAVRAISVAWEREKLRLYFLRNMPCPLCTQYEQEAQAGQPETPRRMGRPRKDAPRPIPLLSWTGISLVCPKGHGWSNPEALNLEMRRCCPETMLDP